MDSETSVEVVTRIASEIGADPAELNPPLYAVVDPTALDALFETASPTSPLTVEFEYQGYRVVVESDGDVSVTESTDRPFSTATERQDPPAE